MSYPEVISLAAHERAVSARYIIGSGELSLNDVSRTAIDLSQIQASGVTALDKATNRALEAMQNDPRAAELLNKPSWDKADRAQYESLLTEKVAAAFDEQPLFHKYRAETGQQENGKKDITHLTESEGFDCDRMSMMKAIMLQRIEDRVLSDTPGDGLKQAQEYYVAGGGGAYRNNQGVNSPPISHAGIISSATGNFIEATGDTHTYIQSRNPHYNFNEFIAGVPFEGEEHFTTPDGKQISEYHQFGSIANDLQVLSQRREDIALGNFDALKEHGNYRSVRPDDFTYASHYEWPQEEKQSFLPPEVENFVHILAAIINGNIFGGLQEASSEHKAPLLIANTDHGREGRGGIV